MKYCIGSAAALGVEISPFGTIDKALAAVSKTAPTYPISRTVKTTLEDATIIPVGTPQGLFPQPPFATIFPSHISAYAANGYGEWDDQGQPFPYAKIDIQTGQVTSPSTPDPHAVQLVSFFTMSDLHICDKESPARSLYLAYQYPYPTLPPNLTPEEPPHVLNFPLGSIQSYSGVILYTTHVVDAAVQTINALHQIKPFDFGICLGDAADNTQYNELRWFVDIMDGKWIIPSSGAHLGAKTIDYQKPYKAAGLNKSIPWYYNVGNHDQFWMGATLVNDYVRKTLVGGNVLLIGAITEIPLDYNKIFQGRDWYMGVVNGLTRNGTIIHAGPVAENQPAPKVAADSNRRSLSINYFMSEFFNTTSKPVGHGFSQQGVINGFACYSFHPVPGIPLKVIVVDDTDKTGGPSGCLDTRRYSWLINQLEAGQADDELMIICAHVPVSPYGYQKSKGQSSLWTTTSIISDVNLIKLINRKYGNAIMWVAGHVHRNTITPQPAKQGADSHDPLYGHGLWMVETPSLRDYPQQFRRFEIVRNSGNKTLSILVDSIDHASTTINGTPSPSLKSRTRAVAAQQIFGSRWQQGPGMDPYPSSSVLNAQLCVQLSQLTPGLQKKLAKI
ncbi:MAG: TIGR03768 family metallophosphoesterase [Syntrophobacteraceae bacterium]